MRSVGFSEWLRPWAHAGVTCFLSEYPVDVSQLAPEFMSQDTMYPSPSLGSRRLAGSSRQYSQQQPFQQQASQQQPGQTQSSPHSLAGSQVTMPPQSGRAGSTPLEGADAGRVSMPQSSSPALGHEGRPQAKGGGEEFGASTSRPPLSSPASDRAPDRTPASLAASSPNSLGNSLTNPLSDSSPGSLSGSLQGPLPLEEWPVPFHDYFTRLTPSPVLWCYEELGQDLFAEPNRERSDCLKRLISKLQFPKGTSVFWPPVIPAVQDSILCQRVLQQVLRELFPKLVILLGTGQTLSLFHGESQPLPFTQCLFKGHMVVFLPDFEGLMESDSLFNQSVRYLRAIVAQLSIV